MYFCLGRCLFELAQEPSRVALAWHTAGRSAPFGVTLSQTSKAKEQQMKRVWGADVCARRDIEKEAATAMSHITSPLLGRAVTIIFELLGFVCQPR